jgi:hypothetical protein
MGHPNQKKLTDDDVRLIRALDKEREYHRMMAERLTRLEIAKKFDISYSTCAGVCDYRTYKDVKDD